VAHAATLSELQIKIGAANGAMTPHEAAIATANAHQAAYNALMEHYSDLLTKIQSQLAAGYLTPEQAGAQREGVSVDRQAAKNNYQIQGLGDTQSAWSTSFSGEVDKTFTDIIAKSQDWGTQFKETVEGALTSVNDAILHILTNKPQAGEHPFRAAGKQIFTGIAKTGLDDAEGSLMKFLTGDKGKLGTKANPMITDDIHGGWGGTGAGTGVGAPGGAGNPGGLAGAALNWANNSDFMGGLFGGKVFGPGGVLFNAGQGGSGDGSGTSKNGIKESNSPTDVNGIIQTGLKVAGMAYGAVKGGSTSSSNGAGPSADWGDADAGSNWTMPDANAGGGVVSPGDWSMVGESGPELAHFGSGARIYSNRDSSAMMRGGGTTNHHTWNIDARGATDPAAINAAVQRGIRQAAPHLVKASAESQSNHHRRTPSRK
jgi:hypothetical protein